MVISFAFQEKKMALVFDFDSISGSAQISFNVQTAKHVQSTAEGWAVLIGFSGTNFAELSIYIALFFLVPLMEELIYRGLLQHAFFKDSRFGLDLLLPSILFALPSFFKPS